MTRPDKSRLGESNPGPTHYEGIQMCGGLGPFLS
jgi:hypothetical protein